MDRPAIDGLRGVKLPVTDLQRSLTWYQQVFDVAPWYEFPDEDGVVRGVLCTVPGLVDSGLALRENPDAAQGIAGFDPLNWHVTDLPALHDWASFLDTIGVAHSPVIEASLGWLLVFHDPDGIEHHLYTRTEHGIDHSDRPGYGRPIYATTGRPVGTDEHA
jgi:catechol 2,3-dioxygenase-like lactoylglutathione lyase family enzyme